MFPSKYRCLQANYYQFCTNLNFFPSNKIIMDSIIHQASPTNENQAELTPLTQPNDGSPGKSGQGRSSRSGGGFLRSLLCCFTGGAEPIAEPVLPQDSIDQPQDQRPPTEPEPCPQQPIVRHDFPSRDN